MIILTGASGGIGSELVGYLCEIDQVIGVYNKSLPSQASNSRLTYRQLNIENPDDILSFAEELDEKISKITIIHAAALKKDGLAVNYDEQSWDSVMRVNLKGNFLLTRALLPYMIKEQWGRIIHLSSLGGIQGAVGTLAYSTSKAALSGMSRVFAKEYARFNITSNILVLGHFKGGMFDALTDTVKKELLNQIPSRALGDIADIANAVEFLIKSGYTNGAVINIDGGI